ncbi:unnamed protein product [Discosporangium mesarthrocarpum]
MNFFCTALVTGLGCGAVGFLQPIPVQPMLRRPISSLAVIASGAVESLPVNVDVLSPREAQVVVPRIGSPSPYRIRWFEADDPSIYDEVTVSLQGRVSLKGLSPGCDYVVKVCGGPEGSVFGDTCFSTPQAGGGKFIRGDDPPVPA